MKLIIVPTPIGNFEDITLRALRVLKEADTILAEDTRTSGNLLKHFDISSRLMPYHKFNEHKAIHTIIERIKTGEKIVLVSDAGTPSISDPGFLIARSCIENCIEVECLPGATALIPALVNSGFPSDRFCFEGFLPQKKGRMKKLEMLKDETRTMIFYESPYRVIKALEQFAEIFGKDRGISVSRELTKIHEETVRGTIEEVLSYFLNHTVKGEFVMVVKGKTDEKEITFEE